MAIYRRMDEKKTKERAAMVRAKKLEFAKLHLPHCGNAIYSAPVPGLLNGKMYYRVIASPKHTVEKTLDWVWTASLNAVGKMGRVVVLTVYSGEELRAEGLMQWCQGHFDKMACSFIETDLKNNKRSI